jgi:hypothetical protein
MQMGISLLAALFVLRMIMGVHVGIAMGTASPAGIARIITTMKRRMSTSVAANADMVMGMAMSLVMEEGTGRDMVNMITVAEDIEDFSRLRWAFSIHVWHIGTNSTVFGNCTLKQPDHIFLLLSHYLTDVGHMLSEV